MKTKPPRIIWGAGILATLSLIWSAYAITDLMASGPFGLSVAVAGDIGWVTVLWAEYRGITLAGRRWAAPAAGWLIALAVAGLLVLHGIDADSTPQAIAGPFVVVVGKTVWTFALAAMLDPAALTAEQESEIHSVMRDSEYQARMHAAELSGIERAADAEIARIRAEARTVLARDEADFEIGLERVRKRGEIARRTPLAITPGPVSDQSTEMIGEQSEQPPNGPSKLANKPSEQSANNLLNSANLVREQPSIADLVRDQIASTTNNADAIRGVMTARPDANRDSVAAAVRRERRKIQPKDGYA